MVPLELVTVPAPAPLFAAVSWKRRISTAPMRGVEGGGGGRGGGDAGRARGRAAGARVRDLVIGAAGGGDRHRLGRAAVVLERAEVWGPRPEPARAPARRCAGEA